MCGIAGILNNKVPVTGTELEEMIAPIHYRGPDGQGSILLHNNRVGLAHRRLSILDTRDVGRQPMVSACGRYWIVFNGEIYNYIELRKRLVPMGYNFKTETDTEVLLNAYAQWGPACLDQFIGMFAFAIWDNEKKELFAARDRLGIKPFYYLLKNQSLLFASEIKSICAVTDSPPSVDTSLIDAYMDFGYVPGANTLFKGIRRLLPGHALIYKPGEDELHIFKYWTLEFAQQRQLSFNECAENIHHLLSDSIALRLRSDVPLGVFLSGGLDSSAVVALLSPGASSGLKTFSVSYDFGSGFDETPYARKVSAQFNTDHHEIRMTPESFVKFVPDYIRHMDEPVTEAAAISLYYVSKLAREHVVVCLSGEGSDELFAGYDFYAYNLAIEKIRNLLGATPTGVVTHWLRKLTNSRKIMKYLAMTDQPMERRYKGISGYEQEVKLKLYKDDFLLEANLGNADLMDFLNALFAKSQSWDPLSRMLYFDTHTWLVDDLLIKADRMSMATSIELRVPFLDHRLVEFAAKIPSKYKLHGKTPKYILKKIMQNRLPDSIINRKKMGFPTPLEFMLRGDLYAYACDTLLSHKSLNRGYFKEESIREFLKKHHVGVSDNHREIWQLLVLEEWHGQHGF
jgi:asparagine synthase (glutamine-hydrolysing)